MEKIDHIKYWKEEADKNWITATYLVDGRQNVMALFMFHLVIEKLLKSHWVKDNIENIPPRTHDLQYLYKQTELNLENDLYDYLAVINNWNIDSRYPDYKNRIYLIANDEYLYQHKVKVNTLRECLLERL